MSNNNVVESTDNKDLQKIYDAKNTTSLFDFNQLQRALGEASIKLDKSNSFELLRKYDSTQKGKLDLAEFKELYSFVIKLQKLFVKAAGKNDHITINDILLIAKELNLLIKPEAIQLFVKIIFEERSGAIEFQEYLGLILYFHDLQRLYKHYIGMCCACVPMWKWKCGRGVCCAHSYLFYIHKIIIAWILIEEGLVVMIGLDIFC
jgi:Ca2+-binding EF-hand superfamily protein